MVETLKVGIIGTGIICGIAHIPNYAKSDRFQLVALYDLDREKAEAARKRYVELRREATGATTSSAVGTEVTVCSSWEELMDMVDVVDICTSLNYHAYYSAMALERNKHVMTEKPMARTWVEANQVARLAGGSTALFQLNDDNLFIPRYLRMKNLIESGFIGDVQMIWMVRGSASSQRPEWFWDPRQCGGGAVLDYGSHAVASSWFLAGYDSTAELVRSQGITVKERTRLIEGRMRDIEVDDDAHFKVQFRKPDTGDWITAVIEATWAEPEFAEDGSDVHGYVEIEGSTGSMRTVCDENGNEHIRIKNRMFGERVVPVRTIASEEESFMGEFDNFASCILHDSPSVLNAAVGERIIKVLNTAQYSELQGRRACSPEELEKWSANIAAKCADPWEAGDAISVQLNEPHRMGRS